GDRSRDPAALQAVRHSPEQPLCAALMEQTGATAANAFRAAVAFGRELAPNEKGGATYKGRVIQEKPGHFYRLKDQLKSATPAVKNPICKWRNPMKLNDRGLAAVLAGLRLFQALDDRGRGI